MKDKEKDKKDKKNSRVSVFWMGALMGVLVTLLVVGIIFGLLYKNSRKQAAAGPNSSTVSSSTAAPEKSEGKEETDSSSGADSDEAEALAADGASSGDTWDAGTTYTGGEVVSFGGKMYKARWWTQGEEPGSGGAWEDLMVADPNAEGTAQPDNIANVPIDATVPQNTEVTAFKIVGYYPSWSPDSLNKVDFNVVTHVNYAFAIPTAEGGLMPLENPQTAQALVDSAHKNGAKALLAVGGWSYHEVPLEPAFVSATESDAKRAQFVDAIVAMCDQYGFDGVDMDWEHPRVDGSSAAQYEATMLLLAEKLHAEGKLLTAAVLSGATPDGNIYYDAAAHSNAVLNAVDWINVMAYDGGDGERHSGYDFAVACGTYWKDTRGLPAHKVVLGVPFYGRPSWGAYEKILESDPSADQKDVASFNGMEAHYNGIPTIQKKTAYAKENLGGIMIWELTQDTTDKSKSLLQAIGDASK